MEIFFSQSVGDFFFFLDVHSIVSCPFVEVKVSIETFELLIESEKALKIPNPVQGRAREIFIVNFIERKSMNVFFSSP